MMQFPRSILQCMGRQFRGPGPRLYRVTIQFALLSSLFAMVLSISNEPSFAATATDAPLNAQKISSSGPVHMQARNITVQITEKVRIRVKSVDALMIATRPNRPISLDDPTSLRIEIMNAETSISATALSSLMNEYVLAHAKTNISELNVTFEDGQVHIAGKLHKLVEIPFSAEGPISVTDNGNLRIHFTKITAAGFVHKKMLDWLGMSLSSVAKAGKKHSLQVVDDDVIFPLHALFPAPHFTGRLITARIEGDELLQVFGKPAAFPPAPMPAEHYIYFRGGVLQFGRLTMQGVDLELLNKDPGQPLNFSIGHVYEQALPGYFKNLPDRGVVAYIASYVPGGGTEKQ